MKLWYMRDDHLFCELPLDVEEAIEVIRQQFAKGQTSGMLCADGGPPKKSMMTIDPYAHARGDFAEFEPRARIWLTAAISYKSPADLEYESWAPAAVGGGTETFRQVELDAARERGEQIARELEKLSALGVGAGATTDTERLDWLLHSISGAELRRLGIVTSAGCTRELIDAAAGVALPDGAQQK